VHSEDKTRSGILKYAKAPDGLTRASEGKILHHSSRRAELGSRSAARLAGIQDAKAASNRNSRTIATNVAGSVALTRTSMLVVIRVNSKAMRKAYGDARRTETQAIANHDLENSGGSCTERHPQSDFCRTLADREYSVKPTTASNTAITAKRPGSNRENLQLSLRARVSE
jgi:hypothetical protein